MRKSKSFSSRLDEKFNFVPPVYTPSYVQASVPCEVNGEFVNKLEVRELDLNEYANLSANDFTTAKVIASGAKDFLKPVGHPGTGSFLDENKIINDLENLKTE